MNGIKRFFVAIVIGIFLLVTFGVSNLFLEAKVYDFMMRIFGANKYGSKDIVIVVVDDDSIAKYRWPWSRDKFANIIEYLDKYAKPKLIIHDAMITSLDKEHPDADLKYFSTVSRLDNFISGMDFSYKEYSESQIGQKLDEAYYTKYSTLIEDRRTFIEGFPFKSIIKLPQRYYDSLKIAAPVIGIQDADGVTRDSSLFIAYKQYLYPYIGFRGYLFANNDPKCIIYQDRISCPDTNFEVKQSSRYIGTYKRVPIKFYKMHSSGYSHQTISAVKILDDFDRIKRGLPSLIDKDIFKDKYVIIGSNVKASATGLSDVVHSAVSSRHSGSDILATVLDNSLHNDFMKTLTVSQNLLVSLVFALFIYLLIRTRTVFVSLVSAVMALVAYFVISGLCFANGLAVSVITPAVVSVVTMIFGYLHRFLIEGQNKEKIKKAMGKYISDDIMEKVVKNIDELKLGGKRSVVTVLFADIRGFTSMSEKMSAEEVSNILNEYFAEVEPIITSHNGIINKFIGDAVMAIFGEPIMDKNHALNAVKCANDMLKTVKKLQHKWLQEGKPKIEIGIGINTGEVFVGNIGSERRMEYTVIGDTVNLASRIESYNKIYKTNFLIGPSTYDEVKNSVNVIKISDVQIRGKAQKLDIYEVLSVVED